MSQLRISFFRPSCGPACRLDPLGGRDALAVPRVSARAHRALQDVLEVFGRLRELPPVQADRQSAPRAPQARLQLHDRFSERGALLN